MNLPLISDREDKSSPLLNRIRKNYRHIRKWALRTNTTAFRIYDRDIKEFPVAIDFYAGRFLIHFFSTDRQSEDPPPRIEDEVTKALGSLFNADAIYWKTRIKRKKVEQYEKQGQTNEFFTVLEYGLTFKVNLLDYLDTGLFLDHRETRQMVAKAAQGKRLLNLFAYTSSFSLHAAKAGASFTKSVDLSNTYTNWSKDNFALNSISLKTNEIIREDCLKFLETEKETYDVIIIDPPTLSRSKKMEDLFDIQRDHLALIKKAISLLSPKGTLFFSTNSRKFKLDESLLLLAREITDKTIPFDFHNKKIHSCWIFKPNLLKL